MNTFLSTRPYLTNALKVRAFLASLFLALAPYPLATASPLTLYETYGCVVEKSSAFFPEQGVVVELE